MATIFVDESGYTGPDLCDPEQPVFVLASHDFSEEESRDLKARFFSKIRIPLKFSKMSRRHSQQRMILECLDFMRMQPERICAVVAHKPFNVVCKAVDLIVEKSMHQRGYDLYDRGANLGLANLIQYVTLSVGGEQFYAELTNAILNFLRTPSEETFDRLDGLLESKTGLFSGRGPDGVLGKTLEVLHLALNDLSLPYILGLSGKDVDVSFTLALGVMASWAGKHGGNMSVVHDASSNMSKQKAQWDKVVPPNVPQAVIGFDRRTMKFPIGVVNTVFEPDDHWSGLQLADVLAGSMAQVLQTKTYGGTEPDGFVKELVKRLDDWVYEDSVWPAAKFTPQELGTEGPKMQDPFTFMGRMIGDED